MEGSAVKRKMSVATRVALGAFVLAALSGVLSSPLPITQRSLSHRRQFR